MRKKIFKYVCRIMAALIIVALFIVWLPFIIIGKLTLKILQK